MRFRYASLVLFVMLLWQGMAILQAAAQSPPATQFSKLDSEGRELPPAAEQWAMVRDNGSGLIWEAKTTDGSIHDKDKVFNWDGAQKDFIDELNRMQFGGFGDWRLPTTDELRTLTVKGAEPYINRDFFPNTAPTSYLSWRKCGSGEIFDERVKFGEQRNSKKDRRVRAVRNGASLEEGN
ncbi:MAG: Lcl C-terminal domain-containing protein [Desulfobulbaceae bacterium]